MYNLIGRLGRIIDKDFRQSYWLALQFWVQPNRIFTVGVPQASHRIKLKRKKNHLLSVNVFSIKVLIEETIFTTLLLIGLPFKWPSKPYECLAICRTKAVASFLTLFKALNISPVLGIEAATSHSAVRYSLNSACPATVIS